jgi:hypothetical protein
MDMQTAKWHRVDAHLGLTLIAPVVILEQNLI